MNDVRHGGVIKISEGHKAHPGVDLGRHFFTAQGSDDRFDSEITHIEGILDDETVDVARLESGVERFAGVETHKFYFTGEASVAEGEEETGGGGFIAAINAGNFAPKAAQEIFGGALGGIAGGAGVLIRGEQVNSGEILFHNLQKPFLAFFGAGRANLEAKHDHLALALKESAEVARRDAAALAVIGGDIARNRLRQERGVDDDYGDFAARCSLDRSDEGFVVEWGEDDPIDVAADKIFHDLDLLFAVIFFQRAFPDNIYRDTLVGQLEFGLFRAGVDGFPKFMRRALRDDGDGVGISRPSGGGRASKQEEDFIPAILHGEGGAGVINKPKRNS